MVDPNSADGTGSHIHPKISELNTFLIGAAMATATSRQRWCDEHKVYAGVPHNKKKKAKRKQAQASRRNNRR